MEAIPYTQAAHDLLHRGAITMAAIESNGMAVDIDYIQAALARGESKANKLEAAMADTPIMQAWRTHYGHKMNTQSGDQLGVVLYDVMGYKPNGYTKGLQYKTDEDSLQLIEDPFVEQYLTIKKLRKGISTYLRALLREAIDGKVHCFFNLHTTRSYRSSSDSFNFQNIPKHDPYIARMIRRAFIARTGRQLVEVDFSGAEVIGATCYCGDPTLKAYVLDPKKDMHRDTACELFSLSIGDVDAAKPIRQLAKSSFVFAEFYGDWYISTSKGLWQNAHILKVKKADGTLLLDHLKQVGITHLGALDPKADPLPGSFEARVKMVEQLFWRKRFPVYAQWKIDNYKAYQAKGWFLSKTGFVYRGYMNQKEVNNYPIQGSMFHCLLWSINKVQAELTKRKMQTLLVGQIHDSIVADVVPSERDEFLAICRSVMVDQLKQHFTWLTLPMKIEADAAPVGASWADMAKHNFAA